MGFEVSSYLTDWFKEVATSLWGDLMRIKSYYFPKRLLHLLPGISFWWKHLNFEFVNNQEFSTVVPFFYCFLSVFSFFFFFFFAFSFSFPFFAGKDIWLVFYFDFALLYCCWTFWLRSWSTQKYVSLWELYCTYKPFQVIRSLFVKKKVLLFKTYLGFLFQWPLHRLPLPTPTLRMVSALKNYTLFGLSLDRHMQKVNHYVFISPIIVAVVSMHLGEKNVNRLLRPILFT